MGLLGSRWEADWQGRKIVVSRNELTKGFKLECDGEELASKTMSLVGVGELGAELDIDGEKHQIKVEIDSECAIVVGNDSLNVRTVK